MASIFFNFNVCDIQFLLLSISDISTKIKSLKYAHTMYFHWISKFFLQVQIIKHYIFLTEINNVTTREWQDLKHVIMHAQMILEINSLQQIIDTLEINKLNNDVTRSQLWFKCSKSGESCDRMLIHSGLSTIYLIKWNVKCKHAIIVIAHMILPY